MLPVRYFKMHGNIYRYYLKEDKKVYLAVFPLKYSLIVNKIEGLSRTRQSFIPSYFLSAVAAGSLLLRVRSKATANSQKLMEAEGKGDSKTVAFLSHWGNHTS